MAIAAEEQACQRRQLTPACPAGPPGDLTRRAPWQACLQGFLLASNEYQGIKEGVRPLGQRRRNAASSGQLFAHEPVEEVERVAVWVQLVPLPRRISGLHSRAAAVFSCISTKKSCA